MIVEVLKAAREFLKDPSHWTKGTAMEKRCLANATWEAGGRDEAVEYLDALASEQGWPKDEEGTLRPCAAFNDAPETTHADVLAFLDKAIARAEASDVISVGLTE